MKPKWFQPYERYIVVEEKFRNKIHFTGRPSVPLQPSIPGIPEGLKTNNLIDWKLNLKLRRVKKLKKFPPFRIYFQTLKSSLAFIQHVSYMNVLRVNFNIRYERKLRMSEDIILFVDRQTILK
jgi:hypothetical protein